MRTNIRDLAIHGTVGAGTPATIVVERATGSSEAMVPGLGTAFPWKISVRDTAGLRTGAVQLVGNTEAACKTR